MKKIFFTIILLIGFSTIASTNDLDKYQKLCDYGNASGCYSLGMLYYDTSGSDGSMTFQGLLKATAYDVEVEPDNLKAIKYFEKSCDGNNIHACLQLATIYEKGEIVQKNIHKVKKYNTKTCHLSENVMRCNMLGIKLTDTQTEDYYKKGCAKDSAYDCAELGLMYLEGKAVFQNDFLAVKFFTKSCKLNEGNGCLYLGAMYADGRGVRQDYSKAKEYFGKACDGQVAEGCRLYSELNR